MTSSPRQWIFCQIGAREHYAIAAELFQRKRLAALFTDVWCNPGSAWNAAAVLCEWAGKNFLGKRLRERYASALEGAQVYSDNPCTHIFPRFARWLLGTSKGLNWRTLIMAENARFAKATAARLEFLGPLKLNGSRPIVFAYSYAALEILTAAKRAGCITVLGQIDPGPEEYLLVAEIARRHGLAKEALAYPPNEYWSNWIAECAIADLVIVNSRWSAELVSRAGVERSKLRVLPLAYRAEKSEKRAYPERFTTLRPLRLLFLGQVCVRKGTVELLQAMRRLRGAPVTLSLVGPILDGVAEQFADVNQIDWLGSVARSSTKAHYRSADVFILPTHSDGFAITQLEALEHGLPLFVSMFCGDVVKEGVNGCIINPVTPEAIEDLVRWAIENPSALTRMSAQAGTELCNFTPSSVVDQLFGAVDSISSSRTNLLEALPVQRTDSPPKCQLGENRFDGNEGFRC